jgi:hypothetical protein
MQPINIIFECGYAGRFLAELFSQSDESVPLFSNKLGDHFSGLSGWLVAEDDRGRFKAPDIAPQSKIPIRPNYLWKCKLDPSISYFGVVLPCTQFNDFWWVHSIELLDLHLCGLNSYRTAQFTEWLPPSHRIDISCFLDHNTWAAEYYRVCDVMGITPNIAAATELYTSWYNLRVKPCKDAFVGQNLSAERKHIELNGTDDWYNKLFLSDLLKEQLAWHNRNSTSWTNFYTAVKASEWPASTDFHSLPVHIQDELVSVYGYSPPLWAKLYDQYGPQHPMEEFSPLRYNYKFIYGH